MIIGQAIFQLTVTLILHFAKGPGFLDYPDAERRSIVFNTFVWMQIFNEFNNRRLDNKFNIFTGLHRNYFFIIINCLMVGCQILIAFVGKMAFSIVPINGVQWAICILVAALSWPWAIVVRTFPDDWFAVVARVVGKPVVMVYRPLSRGIHRLGGMMPWKRKKEVDDAEATETAVSEQRDIEKV